MSETPPCVADEAPLSTRGPGRTTSFLFVAIVVGSWLLAGGTAAQPLSSARHGARLALPDRGSVHALVIFVQHADVPDGAGEFGTDPVTEWPTDHSLGPDRRLPTWAENDRFLAPPGTAPSNYDQGSLSAFYHLMSHGRFHLTGHVYPRVYVPRHPVDWYHEHRGHFPNGAVKLAHEMLTSSEIRDYFTTNPDSLDLSVFDTFRNGTNIRVPDGVFDLILVIHRDPVLPRLRRDPAGRPGGGSSITSFGADLELRLDHPVDYLDPTSDAFAPDPVSLAGLRVIDNVTSGSGITGHALTRKQAVRIAAHEIGHRHFGLYHTCSTPNSPDADCLGIMGGAYVTMSAPDRIKLGWTRVVPVDVPRSGKLVLTVPDALASDTVFRLRDGTYACGDVVVEARFWSNFWDAPPNPDDPDALFYQNDDGDSGDLFLPEEGLYLYKAPETGNPRCGGSLSPEHDYQEYSSLENNGLHTRLVPFRQGLAEELKAFRVGGTYKVAYVPGDAYAPFALPRFYFHRQATLDKRLTITGIERSNGAFSVQIWTDFLIDPTVPAASTVQVYPNPFAEHATIRYEVRTETTVRLHVYDARGRRVATLAEGLHQPGVHERPFDATGLAGGLYWCRIELGDETRVAPMHVVR